jgi:hypothetical protein
MHGSLTFCVGVAVLLGASLPSWAGTVYDVNPHFNAAWNAGSGGATAAAPYSFGTAVTPGSFTPFALEATDTVGTGMTFRRMYYSDTPGDSYPSMMYFDSPVAYTDRRTHYAPHEITVHPREVPLSPEYAAIRFSAPVAGVYDLDVSFFARADNLDRFHQSRAIVLLNGSQVFSQLVSYLGFPGPAGATYANQWTLGANDTIDVLVGTGDGTNWGDTTAIHLSIEGPDVAAVPLPAAAWMGVALLGGSLAPAGLRRWRSRG